MRHHKVLVMRSAVVFGLLVLIIELFDRTASQTVEKKTACTAGQIVYNKCGDRCICSSNGKLTKCTRIRKEFTSMTYAERKRYVAIIKKASTLPRYKNEYDALITRHKECFHKGIHEIKQFLPWHRWYIIQYENVLREIDCRFTVAYWDYVATAGKPFGTTQRDLWYSGLGGFGDNGVAPNRCVKTGPFRKNKWQLVPSADPPKCLKRDFFGTPPGEVELAILQGLPHTSFKEFECLLRGDFHDNIHCLIGGTMCRGDDSAAAPEFFLLHGMVDKIWEDWQQKSNTHRKVYFSSINTSMTCAGGRLAKNYLDNNALPGGIRVKYRPIGDKQIYNVYRSLISLSRKQLQSIPREKSTPLLQKTIDLFKISVSKVLKIREMEEMIRPRQVRNVSASAPAIDQKLGFDHKVADSA